MEKEILTISSSLPTKRNFSRMRTDREIQKKVEINGLRTDRELDPVHWEEIIESDAFVDDAPVQSQGPSNPEAENLGDDSNFFYSSLKQSYLLAEKRDNVRALDVFQEKSISSKADQELLLNLWNNNYNPSQKGLRRGEILFYFCDEEEFGSEEFEKFVIFHVSVVASNQYGEIDFVAFVSLHQLLDNLYRSPHSIIGKIVQRANLSFDSSYSEDDMSSSKEYLSAFQTTEMLKDVLHDKERPVQDQQEKEKHWKDLRISILKRVTCVAIEQNEFLFKQGEELTHIFFVFYGSIQVYRETEDRCVQIFEEIRTGGAYGIVSLISKSTTFIQSGKATTKSFVLKVPIDGFQHLIQRDWQFTWSLISATLISLQRIRTVLQSEALQIHSFRKKRTNSASPRHTQPLMATSLSNSASSLSSSFASTPRAGSFKSSAPSMSASMLAGNATNATSNSALSIHVPTTTSATSSFSETRILEMLNMTFGVETEFSALILSKINQSENFLCTSLATGEYIYRLGDSSEEISILLKGVAVRIIKGEFQQETELYPGDIVGETGLFTRMDRTTDIRCKKRCDVLVIRKAGIVELAKEKPEILQYFVKKTIQSIFEHLKSLEYSYKYFTLQNGEHLIKPNDPSDSFYFLINGQLRVQQEEGDQFNKVGEYSRIGGCIGLKELLQERNHTQYTTAVRDTELIQFDKVWVTQLMRNNPKGIQNLIKTALSKDNVETSLTRKIIGVVPVSNKVPVMGFLCNLVKTMKVHGSIKVITEALVEKKFGVLSSLTTFSSHQNIWNYLATVNAKYDFVFCVCKPNISPWTRWMLKHVDTTLVVAHDQFSPELSDWEFSLNFYHSTFYMAEKRLIILHTKGGQIENTKEFLLPRQSGIGKVSMWHHLYEGDRGQYESIARFLSGNAIGIVLGGGGARGISHIGTIKALREAGIPIDLVGGVSIGSQVGGMVASGMSLTELSHQIWKVYVVNYLADFTFPYMSLLSGRIFSQRVKKYIGMNEKLIEDLNLPYFCLSCNLSDLAEHIHDEGKLWEAMRASSSLPLLFPPVLLDSGSLLVDGGYVNNLPVDVMRQKFGANILIAVDVGDYSKLFSKGFKEYMSGWMILIDSLLGRDVSIYPTVYQLLLQLGGVLDFQKQDTRDQYADLVIRPDLKASLGFKVSSWEHFHYHDSLIETGYISTRNYLNHLAKENPELCNRIMKKANYPRELKEGPDPLPFRRRRWFDYLVGTFLHPKLIVILIIFYGVYKVAFWIFSIVYFTHRQTMNVVDLISQQILLRLKRFFEDTFIGDMNLRI